jgi:hypothetical protein
MVKFIHWTTTIYVENLEKLLELKKVCEDISKRDPSFDYSVNEKLKKIFIYSQSKDQAHKRGMWFHHKFGVFYEVSLRGIIIPDEVRER